MFDTCRGVLKQVGVGFFCALLVICAIVCKIYRYIFYVCNSKVLEYMEFVDCEGICHLVYILYSVGVHRWFCPNMFTNHHKRLRSSMSAKQSLGVKLNHVIYLHLRGVRPNSSLAKYGTLGLQTFTGFARPLYYYHEEEYILWKMLKVPN